MYGNTEEVCDYNSNQIEGFACCAQDSFCSAGKKMAPSNCGTSEPGRPCPPTCIDCNTDEISNCPF